MPERRRDDAPIALRRRAAEDRAHDSTGEASADVRVVPMAIEKVVGFQDELAAEIDEDHVGVRADFQPSLRG